MNCLRKPFLHGFCGLIPKLIRNCCYEHVCPSSLHLCHLQIKCLLYNAVQINLASSSSMCAIFSLLQHAEPTSSSFCRQPLPAQTQLHPTTTIDRQIIGLLTHCVVMVTDFHPMQYLIPPLICKIPYDLGYINSASSIYG
jgi:hypothetical protein